jgi:hypothetical protein
MTEIEIQPSTFERLQRHAKPFVDTPDAVINRALDALEGSDAEVANDLRAPTEGEERIDPRVLPRLTHTKVLEAAIDGESIPKANWNMLLDIMLRKAMKQVGTFEKLQKVCPVNMINGRKEDEGYSWLPDIKVSVQGQDSNAACRTLVTAAQALGMSLEIGFMWRHKEGAAKPGVRARLQVPGAKNVRQAVA